MANGATHKACVRIPAHYLAWTLLIALAGCNQAGTPDPQLNIAAAPEQENAAAPATKVAVAAQQEESFLEATLQEPPGDALRPVDMLVSGKPTWKIYKAVVGDAGKGGLWEQVKFVTPDGQRIQYTALIKTDAGTMTMQLLSDIAPNHVRNFVALARAGYYDGLRFERTVREEVAVEPGKFVEYIEGGCPKGTGEANHGSIGWWMKPEISAKVSHEPGMVGASHGPDIETAACKFYITLNKAPWLDGEFTIFGKITQGLEVARSIFERPRLDDIADRPREPVVIRQVIIQTSMGAAVARQ